jgi:hypothetical protein
MKSKAINNTKNNKKNNNNRNVNLINCQTNSSTIRKIRKTAQRGIDSERNSIATKKRITITLLNICKSVCICIVETIKKSYRMRTNGHNDETLSHTECCNMLRNGRAEWS